MRRSSLSVLLLTALLALPSGVLADEAATATAWDYPETRRVDAVDVMHGVEVPDPYRWLEEDDAPDVVAWDRAQHALLQRYLEGVPGRDRLRERIAAELDLGGMRSVPSFYGSRRFHTYRPKGANHAILFTGDADGSPDDAKVLIDPNAWSEDGTEGMVDWVPSPDGSLVVYTRDSRGSEASTLYVRDVASGEDLPEVITRTKFTSVAWAPDGSGFVYCRLPDPDDVPAGEEQYHRRAYWHRLGTLVADDVRVSPGGRPLIEWPWVQTSSDRRHLLFGRELADDTIDYFEIVFLPGPEGPTPHLVPLYTGLGTRTEADRVGDTYVLLTDWKAPRRAVYGATGDTIGDPETWTPILPEGEGVIEAVTAVGEDLVVHLTENVVSRLRVVGLDGSDRGEIALPGPGMVRDITTRPGDSRIGFSFASYSHPPTNYVCDLADP
ncbi:MAG: prolyl oligopeptidase family protein, partial [Planctomycetota bacterium]